MRKSNYSQLTILRLQRRLLCTAAFQIMLLPVTTLYGQSFDANYVKTETMIDSTGDRYRHSITYFDGLGRPVEEVEGCSNSIATDRNNIYNSRQYDVKGRVYGSALKCLGTSDPRFLDPILLGVSIHATYSDSITYSIITYDPLDRTTFISTPGDSWEGKGQAVEFIANAANSVRKYRVRSDAATAPTTDGYYPAGSLTGERHIDEDGVAVTTYKDFMGRIILERRGTDDDTYFIYNQRGLLRFILSPMHQEAAAASNRFVYKYDSKGRLTSKQVPGGGLTEYTYDRFNRVLTIRDARLRAAGLYRYFVYDGLGRTVIQGTCTGWNITPTTVALASREIASGTYQFCSTGYYVDDGLQLANPMLEIVNYYDDYTFLGSNLWTTTAPEWDFSTSIPARATTLPTGTISATSDGHYLFTALYYDERGRVTDTRQSLLDGSLLKTATTYDFQDKPLNVQTTLQIGECDFPIVETFTYDDRNFSKPKYHDLTYADSTARVSTYEYDEFARLISERKHDQHISTAYTYNLHDWPTSIYTTKTFGSYSTLFNQDLYYETGQGTPCYNGNISAMRWSNSNSGHGYIFTYDGRDRLTAASHTLYNMSTYPICYSEQMTYNRNSAITSLTRTGNGASNYGNMDVLIYSYTGNKLQNIYDYGTSNVYDGIFEFVSNTVPTNGNRYTYNSAGDLIQDANKGLSLIEYDLFGHPRRIQHHNGNITEYVYAATGEKLRVKHTTAVEGLTVPLGQALELTEAQTMDVDSVDYWGSLRITKSHVGINHGAVGLTYQFGGGYFALTPEPYRPPGSVQVGVRYVPSFHYYVPDYQGNVRLVVDGNGTVEQRNDYYAYGGPWGDNAINQGFQPNKYNGKELDRVHGLDWYDYGARMYDPAMGLFTQLDPLCEQYPHLNPYQYCAGNPVKYVDPDGKSIWTKLIKGAIKISKQVVKHGVKALGETATYATAVADIVDDVNVLTDNEAPTSDRIWAGVSLASEFLPVSINDAKDVGKILRNQKKIPYNGGLAKPHGGKRHNAEIDRYIDNISVDPEVSHIRKNQKQVDFRGQTVGDNRPDIQYDKGNKHYNVEFDYKESTSRKHKQRISDNDPDAQNIFFIMR